jgi:spheroidene monooxygenase
VAPRGRIASLTRASIRLGKAAAFWRRAPPAQASLDTVPGCQFTVGLGEAPLLRQATFSVWENSAAMDAYARDGAHLEAIRAARAGDHFSESMFVRFEILGLEGRWHGEPLDER